MSYIIKIFKYIAEGLVKVLGFITSLPGMIVTLFTTLGTSLYEGFDFLISKAERIERVASDVSDRITEFTSAGFVASDYFQALSYTLALDQAWGYIYWIVGFFVSVVLLLLVTIVPFIITFGFSVTVINTTKNLVQSFIPAAYRFG